MFLQLLCLETLLDPGNNNYIASLSKANYDPSGIDFGWPSCPFTDGRTIVDIVGHQLGLDFTPPYLAPTTRGSVILKEVNYASGDGGGILNQSGYLFRGRINLDAQMDNFENTRQDIVSMIGVSAAQELFKNAIFTVSMGSNDFVSNYIAPGSTVQREFVSPAMFVASMTSKYRLRLTRLRNLGGRKFVVANVGPIGCMPYQRDTNPGGGDECVSFPNELARSFNAQLKSLIEELNNNLEGSIFVYADAYSILEGILQNYKLKPMALRIRIPHVATWLEDSEA